jgi:hypothetical protein
VIVRCIYYCMHISSYVCTPLFHIVLVCCLVSLRTCRQDIKVTNDVIAVEDLVSEVSPSHSITQHRDSIIQPVTASHSKGTAAHSITPQVHILKKGKGPLPDKVKPTNFTNLGDLVILIPRITLILSSPPNRLTLKTITLTTTITH